MIRLMTDNLTGDTVALSERFNPWNDGRVWLETGRVSSTHADIRALVDLTVNGVTAEEMYYMTRQIDEK